MSKNLMNWIKQNKRFVKIRAIEQELKMPDSTLIKAVNEVQNLPKKWIKPLNEFLITLKK
jgi:hypothetical protein